MPEERSQDALRYDYLACVRVMGLTGGMDLSVTSAVCRTYALRLWEQFDEATRSAIDSRFWPGTKEGP